MLKSSRPQWVKNTSFQHKRLSSCGRPSEDDWNDKFWPKIFFQCSCLLKIIRSYVQMCKKCITVLIRFPVCSKVGIPYHTCIVYSLQLHPFKNLIFKHLLVTTSTDITMMAAEKTVSWQANVLKEMYQQWIFIDNLNDIAHSTGEILIFVCDIALWWRRSPVDSHSLRYSWDSSQ